VATRETSPVFTECKGSDRHVADTASRMMVTFITSPDEDKNQLNRITTVDRTIRRLLNIFLGITGIDKMESTVVMMDNQELCVKRYGTV
jgi:hypothetical protein